MTRMTQTRLDTFRDRMYVSNSSWPPPLQCTTDTRLRSMSRSLVEIPHETAVATGPNRMQLPTPRGSGRTAPKDTEAYDKGAETRRACGTLFLEWLTNDALV
jgi:hypothetical protein